MSGNVARCNECGFELSAKELAERMRSGQGTTMVSAMGKRCEQCGGSAISFGPSQNAAGKGCVLLLGIVGLGGGVGAAALALWT
jgi:hypothetical protein